REVRSGKARRFSSPGRYGAPPFTTSLRSHVACCQGIGGLIGSNGPTERGASVHHGDSRMQVRGGVSLYRKIVPRSNDKRRLQSCSRYHYSPAGLPPSLYPALG